jgi:hypothetical protein
MEINPTRLLEEWLTYGTVVSFANCVYWMLNFTGFGFFAFLLVIGKVALYYNYCNNDATLVWTAEATRKLYTTNKAGCDYLYEFGKKSLKDLSTFDVTTQTKQLAEIIQNVVEHNADKKD